MVSRVGNRDIHAEPREFAGANGQSLLIDPTEEGFVIPDEPVVVVAHRVWRVAVHDVARLRRLQRL